MSASDSDSGDIGRVDFFVSYAKPDQELAEWATDVLAAAGYSVELDIRHWLPGDNVVLRMNDALERADRVLALYSAAYFDRERFTVDEWTAVLAERPDRQGRRRLLPVRVEDVEPPPILRALAFRDLFGLSEQQARDELLAAAGGVQRRSTSPSFPLPATPGPLGSDQPTRGSRVLRGHSGAVRALVCAMVDGRLALVSGGDDRVLRIWDATTGALKAALGHHTDAVLAMECTTIDGKSVVASGGDDRVLRIWELSSGDLVASPQRLFLERAFKYAFKYPIEAIACCELDDQPVAITMETESRGINDGSDNRIRLWNLADREFRATLFHRPQSRRLSGVACTVLDGLPVVVIAREYGRLQVFNLRSMARLCSIPRWGFEPVYALACCELNDRPVAVTCGTRADVWDLRSRKRLFRLEADPANLTTIACGKLNGRPVAVIGGSDSRVRIWDLLTHGLLATLETAASVKAVTLGGPDDRVIAIAGCNDGSIWIWDLAKEIRNHDGE